MTDYHALADKLDRLSKLAAEVAAEVRKLGGVQPPLFPEPPAVRFDPLAAELPYDDEEYREAWRTFCKSRSESRKKVTETACRGLLAKLKGCTRDAGLWALLQSAASNWAGIFPEKYSAKGTAKSFARQDEERFNRNLMQNATRGDD